MPTRYLERLVAFAAVAFAVSAILAAAPGRALGATPTIQIPSSVSPAPAGGSTADPAEVALAAAQAHLAVLQAQIDPLVLRVEALTARVAKISARLTAASDAVERARMRLAFSESVLGSGLERGAFGLAALVAIVGADRAGLRSAEDRVGAVRAGASADPAPGALFDASASLETLQAERDATQTQIEDLLVRTRVDQTGARTCGRSGRGATSAASVPLTGWPSTGTATGGKSCQRQMS
jgi:hypothetical protein